MYKLLRQLFDIRREEAPRALLMFAYLFLVIASLLIVKPVRNALFLEVYDVEQLPYVFVLVALTAAVVTSLYSRFAAKIRLHRLIQATLSLVVSNLILFWILLRSGFESGWFVYLFYVWVAIFAVIATSQFWILANYVFDAREAKRLFGFLGAGGISGGIVGGYLSNLAPLIGTENLLLLCAVFLSLCIILTQKVWSRRRSDPQVERQQQHRQVRHRKGSGNPVQLLKRSRLLLYLAGIVGISVVVANLVDYQYNAVVEVTIRDTDQRTAFFGFWLSNLSIISLVIQFFFTRRILGRFGVGPSLLFLPLGILAGAAAILFSPVLWAAILLKVSDGSFKQSINKAAIELLIVPIPPAIKPQAKSFIDVFIDSFATGLGGLLLIIFGIWWGFGVPQISLVVIGLIFFWILLVLAVRREYIEAFRAAIEKRSIDPGEQTINLHDVSMVQSLIQRISGDNERQILYVLQLLENVQHDMFLPYMKRLLRHPSAEIRARVLEMLSAYQQVDFSREVHPLVNDPAPEVRILSIDYLLKKIDLQAQDEFLRQKLNDPDIRTRAAALRCLGRAAGDDPASVVKLNLDALVQEELNLARSPDTDPQLREFLKVNLAGLVGEVQQPLFYPVLKELLEDDSPVVQEEAVRSAGELLAEEFIDLLIRLLDNRHLRKTLRVTLARYGVGIIPRLKALLHNPHTPGSIRHNLPRVLAMIGAQESVEVLLNHLNVADLALRYEVLRSLNRLRKNFPMLVFPRKRIEHYLFAESQTYRELGQLYQALRTSWKTPETHIPDNGRFFQARELLLRALKERQTLALDRMFRLLGLFYQPGDMYSAYLGVTSANASIRANALEFLDNILDLRLKAEIVAAVESYHREQHGHSPDLPDQHACLDRLLASDDWWLAACAVFTVAHCPENRRYQSRIERLRENPHRFLRETARYAIRKGFLGP